MSAPPAEQAEKPRKRVHPVDEVLPLPQLATYGFQHVVAFYAGAVLVPIIIAGAINLPAEDLVKLITADLFTCGIFGFPLVICARETEHFDRVLKNGWSRMDNSDGAEKAFALIEIAKIANYRFDDLVADANPIAAARFSRLNELQ